MSGRLREMMTNLRKDPLLFSMGMLGIVLGAGLILFVAVRGSYLVEPEGHLRKAVTFDLALGILVLTMVLMERAAPMSKNGRRAWAGSLAGLVLYAYGMENIQILRGIDPRFTEVGSATDQILGGVFFLSALLIMVCFIVLAVRFFRRPTEGPDGPLLIALRYGSIACIIGFGVGIVISANSSASMGEAGNWLPLHALGFHGVQAVPLVALMLGWAGAETQVQRNAVHISGAAWLTVCIAVGAQTLGGRSVLEVSIAMIVAVAAFVVWGAAFTRAALEAV